MVEPTDMTTTSTLEIDSSGNATQLSVKNSEMEEKEPEKSKPVESKESPSALEPIDHSRDGSTEEEQSEGVGSGITPLRTSFVDSCPSKPDIDVDTNITSFQSNRIEPEGTTPVISRFSQKFDDSFLSNLMPESRERKGNKESSNAERMQRIESENAIATPEENDNSKDTNGEDATKKKPKEPPGTPAKHERNKSETADEREQRIKDTNNHHQEVRTSLDKRRMETNLLNDAGGIDEKKDDDEASIRREPSRSSILVNNSRRDTSDKNDHEEQPTTDFRHEKSHETPASASVKDGKLFMESPTRKSYRHGFEFNNSHDVHGKSHQPQTYNENIRQTPDTLSPDFFLGDNESIPIPHLPSLTVPGMGPGMGPSYDSFSTQGQGQQVHLNHNGYQHQFHQMPSLAAQKQHPVLSIPSQVTTMPGGKRKIHLHLWEDVSTMMQPETSSFLSFRRKKGILRRSSQQSSLMDHGDTNDTQRDDSNGNDGNKNRWADRGTLTVSWYEGTNSLELQEHVQNSVIRKLGLKSTTKLLDFRVLDESSDPPEEIVLSPYIPNGSKLVVRFATTDGGDLTPPKFTRFSDYSSGPPDSPSAAPSPYPTSLDLNGLGLNANQLALLGTRLNSLQVPHSEGLDTKSRGKLQPKNGRKSQPSKQTQAEKKSSKDGEDEEDTNSRASNLEVASLHPEDQIQKSLREITSLLLKERGGRQQYVPRQEKRQVIFVLANYFVLFLSLIAICAEIQARAEDWQKAMEQQLKNVHDCSKDKESLFTCVENGDVAGLVASVILWVSRSAATKRIFLFGFGSPNKLWTAVYESLVTAICWGFSYMFIRRGMNPDNNRDFLRRYWKDAVYGSLAGFNAAFMKQVLKNLIPKEAIEDALQERQLKILSWLPSIG